MQNGELYLSGHSIFLSSLSHVLRVVSLQTLGNSCVGRVSFRLMRCVHSCIYALLNSNLEVLLFGPTKNRLTGKWSKASEMVVFHSLPPMNSLGSRSTQLVARDCKCDQFCRRRFCENSTDASHKFVITFNVLQTKCAHNIYIQVSNGLHRPTSDCHRPRWWTARCWRSGPVQAASFFYGEHSY